MDALDRAVDMAARDAQAARLLQAFVLLSPANFEVWGDEFRDLALRIPGVGKP